MLQLFFQFLEYVVYDNIINMFFKFSYLIVI